MARLRLENAVAGNAESWRILFLGFSLLFFACHYNELRLIKSGAKVKSL
jgi:hypothetical protein